MHGTMKAARLHGFESTHGSQQFREPERDASGAFILYVGEFVTVDSISVAGSSMSWRRFSTSRVCMYEWSGFQ